MRSNLHRWRESLIMAAWLFAGCKRDVPPAMTGDTAVPAVNNLAKTEAASHRLNALLESLKAHYAFGHMEEAISCASELLSLVPNCSDHWNSGNAVHIANLVLGLVAIDQGRTRDAKLYLIRAGKTLGSPQLNSFGPNMSLAKLLLEKGERDVVLEYFRLCGEFWINEEGRLAQWSRDVKIGKIPDFGPNLVLGLSWHRK